MSVPIGIGSLATGLVQGMRMKKEDDRQAEQDAMRRQEFNLQQESRQFDLSNARKVGERQDAEYTRAQGIQQKQDAFKKNFDAAYTAFSSGNEAGAIAGVEATLNDPTLGLPHKAVVDRDASGNPVKGPKGYTLRYMDPATGKEVSRVEGDADTILGGAYVAHDAIGEYGKRQDEKKSAAAKAADRAFDLKKIEITGAQRIKAAQVQSEASLKAIRERAKLGIAGAGSGGKPKNALSANGLNLLKDYTTAGKDEDGNAIIKPVLNTQKLGSFQKWAKDNNVQPNDEALQVWLGDAAPPAYEDPATAPASIDFSELE